MLDYLYMLKAPGVLTLEGAPEGRDAQVLGEIAQRSERLSLFIARDLGRASAFEDALRFFAPSVRILRFSAWDCLPYDRLSPTPDLCADRMAVLADLLSRDAGDKTPTVIIASVAAVSQRVPPKEAVMDGAYRTRVGREVKIADLERYFTVNGYRRASTVSERGEYAIRGGVIDAFAPGAPEPVRLDLFGDTLESIRAFDPDTQRTTRQLREVDFSAVSEALLDEPRISHFRRQYLSILGAPGDDPLYAAVSQGIRRQGLEHWLPLFYERLETLFDYLPDDALIFTDHQVNDAFGERLSQIKDAYESRIQGGGARGGTGYRALAPEALFLTEPEWRRQLASRTLRPFSPFETPEAPLTVSAQAKLGRSFAAERAMDGQNLFEAVAAYAKGLIKDGKRVLFASFTAGASERLASLLTDHGLKGVREVADWPEALTYPPALPLRAALPLEHGFAADDLVVISETDILGDRLARPKKRKRAQNFLAEASSLAQGDFVVHIDHGIGQYAGLQTLDVAGAPHDCLELHYAADAKLYLPVENIDLLTRYGAETDGVQLDRLGGAAWQSRKAKAKARLREMADGLIQLAAARSVKTSDSLAPSGGLYDEFCARFPYDETDDQLSAIHDVLEDLGAGKPMDRLICGDVGFGKTEVALRAAFVAAMSGKQVVVVCPTTLLARQHHKTFVERFRGWPIKVGRLSRLVPAKEANETRAGLADGTLEIVVGTHAILSEQVKFRDLGLVIVDEEQHFGVKHKERLKSLRADVHVLTLSATPIPRTLQMALSGIREMSIIATPPVDRLAVRTYVTPFDPVTVREALLREKYRGGQAYYVVPRIKDLTEVETFLREQVPEVKYVVGHGQMSPTQLEDVMTAFYDGAYDVLLSTTIVESGLDVPTANTLIVHRADMFGLAQLYQLRGRVGRSKSRAFAFVTTPADKQLSLGAERRLKVLQSLDTLGAGFQLASHDLDIRGGGNLLGDEQSGHIREIGVELYQQMLEDAVAELKEGGASDFSDARAWSPQINVGASVLIPEAYVPDLTLRLSLYRRLSDAENQPDREAIAAELIDRFGPLPEECRQLLKVVTIKGLCRQANVSKIDVGPKGAVVAFRGEHFANPAALVGLVQKRAADWRLRPDQKLVVKGEWGTAEQRLAAAEALVTDLAKAAAA